MLNLVKVEILGFKSFADKVTIPFNEGVTAIIGPNGCGKSNVADAIKWALGEQKYKQLRGNSMREVIFAGTEKRKSMSYCEVSLVFNNEGSRLFSNMPFDEVKISRRLDRSGKSEYLINNSTTRLADIIDMLKDTGIGKDGYSIIGQGKVDEIMSAKPEDRRKIFEEAAGISKFRSNKEDTERTLEKVNANINTINNVIDEIERQIGPLQKQAESARRYEELSEELKLLEVNQFIYAHEHNESIQENIRAKIKSYREEFSKREKEFNEISLKYDNCLRELNTLDSNTEKNNTELTALKVGEAHIQGDVRVTEEKIAAIKNEIKRLTDEVTSKKLQLDIARDLLKKATDERVEAEEGYISSKSKYDDALIKFNVLKDTLEGSDSDRETRQEAYVRFVQELGDLKANSSKLQMQLTSSRERQKVLNDELVSDKKRLDAEIGKSKTLSEAFKALMKTKTDLTDEYNGNVNSQKYAENDLKLLEDKVAKKNVELSANSRMLEIDIAAKENYSQYQPSVKGLMNSAKTNPAVKSKIMGIVAEVISVPKEYETAIDYALGATKEHVLVRDENDAGYLINHLKDNNIGRVTFRPMTSSRPQRLDPDCMAALREPGCFGIASDLIKYEAKFEPFIKALLGATVVVDNLENGIRIFRKYHQGFRIVTLDGEIFSRAGEMTGGSRRMQGGGLLSQEKKIADTKERIEKIRKDLSDAIIARNAKEDEIEELKEKNEALAKRLSEIRVECGLNEEKLTILQGTLDTLQEEIDKKAAIYNALRDETNAIAVELQKSEENASLLNKKIETYNELLSTSKTESDKQKSEREETSNKLMILQAEMIEKKNLLDSLDEKIARLTSENATITSELQAAEAALSKEQAKLNEITEAASHVTVSKETAEKIAILEKEKKELFERKRAVSDEISTLASKKDEISENKTKLTELRTREEAALETVINDMNALTQYILTTYNLSYDEALKFKDEEYKDYGTKTKILDVKRRINLLGPINPLAAETLKEVEARLEENQKVRDDLVKSGEDLMTTIDNFTANMRELFSAAFTKISENFKVVFSQLFGGGKGELRLDKTASDDVLEQGIEIFAQPPGKKLQNIGLLSGGERALTAIAILFAILKLKPMPFCILDEIEAALDDANVNLFAEFLKKFSDFTQFIVITHRKPTMRHADTIFGVTMEEKGVTKIVSVELEEAEKQARPD